MVTVDMLFLDENLKYYSSYHHFWLVYLIDNDTISLFRTSTTTIQPGPSSSAKA